MNTILAIDAGNSRIKWGIHDGAGWLEQVAEGYDGLPLLAEVAGKVPKNACVVISSVAGKRVDTALQEILAKAGLECRWARSQAKACGVRNAYADPGQLGSDRWMALVASWNLRRCACVVATAGTALTVDALSSRGEFLGGLIVPGMGLMKASLASGTSGVAQLEGTLQDFPTSTGDAVQSGMLAAMAGAVMRQCELLAQREGIEPVLLLSGGDAQAMQETLSGKGEILDNLVLEGLVFFAKDNAG